MRLGTAGRCRQDGADLGSHGSAGARCGWKKNRVIVWRVSSAVGQSELQAIGVETIRCDLLDEQQVAGLPEAIHVIMMTGMKFGTAGNSSMTWAVNDYAPMLMASRYRTSRIDRRVSTGNVYGLTTPDSGGSKENDELAPVGEYP